jgi:hypothetical protein
MIETLKAARPALLLLFVLLVPAGCGSLPTAPQEPAPSPTTPPATTPATVEPAHKTPLPRPAPATPQAQPPGPKHLVHTVKYRGETLGSIAAWYTGSGRNWEHLVKANPGLDPRRMPIGIGVRIPENLLITRNPMPEMIPSQAKQTRPQPAPNKPPAPAAVELFGPVEAAAQVPVDSGLSRQLQSLD